MNTSAPKSRFTRFGIRALLIATTSLGICLGWLASIWAELKQEHVVAREIVTIGGTVEFEGTEESVELPGADAFSSAIVVKRPWWERVRIAIAGQHVLSVNLDEDQSHDLTKLVDLKKLKRLSVNHGEVRDFSPLVVLQELETVYLNGTSTNALASLGQVRSLKRVILFDIPVSDEEVGALRRALPSCEVIVNRF